MEVVRAEDLPNAWSNKASGDRKSRRARKGRAAIIVNSWHTLHELKLRVFQVLDVHPGNAMVSRWKEVDALQMCPLFGPYQLIEALMPDVMSYLLSASFLRPWFCLHAFV